MQLFSSKERVGKSIGFVPTMGYLHQGHISLVQESKKENDITIVSIFVNPTQFSPNEDLSKYPRDYVRDHQLLLDAGCDVLFYPDVEEIYPKDFQTFVTVDEITQKLEGEFRPTHFRGVTTIVNILFNIVQPHKAYFGQKDAQQCAVISKMVEDLNMNLSIVVCPIVREDDGLAMSSRNVYLSPSERNDALVLSKALKEADSLIKRGERDSVRIKSEMISILKSVDTSEIDYAEIVDFKSFEKVSLLEEGNKYLILIACRIGKTRLIDNQIIYI